MLILQISQIIINSYIQKNTNKYNINIIYNLIFYYIHICIYIYIYIYVLGI